jgi:type IV pilus assembly protein PilN
MMRINLLPVRVSKKKAVGKQQLVLFALVIVGAVIVNFVWSSSRASELAAREAKLKRTREEIQQLDRIIGEVKNIRDQQGQLREKLEILAGLKANRSGPVRVLDALATVTPKRLWLTKVEEKSGVVTFAGSAATIDDVSEFMTQLKKTPYFKDVELTKTLAKTDKALRFVDFTLTAAVLYSGKAPEAAAAVAKAR